MKKKFKGALSLLLCMIMVFGAVAVGGEGIELPSIKELFGSEAQAASEKYDIYTYKVGSDGTVTITGCDDSAQGAITIPSQIDGKPVTSIGSCAFHGCSSLTSITIPNSVTSIGIAFDWCKKLTQINVDTANTVYSSVNGVLFNKEKTKLIRYPIGKADTSYSIPDGVTSIGDYAFSWCSSLTSITIPDGVTIIDRNAFQYCRSLTSITIPDSVTYISAEAFDGCDSLKAAYYLGFSEQWAEVSIEWGNYRLTYCIVFKSNPEIGDVASPTGTKVSMVGKHFYANIGESELSLSP